MSTTVVVDDDLVAKAQRLTGIKDRSSLLNKALQALIERESARRLVRRAGTERTIAAPRRRRNVAY